MSSLMHLVLVMGDASIVNVFLCLKVISCQIVLKTHSKCTQEIEMKDFFYQNTFSCRGEMKYEEFSQCLCFYS